MPKLHRIHIKNPELIKKIVNKHLIEGKTYFELSQEYNINWNTIAQWVYKYKNFNWNFERKIHKVNYTELEYLRLENEILKKFLLFQKGWKQE